VARNLDTERLVASQNRTVDRLKQIVAKDQDYGFIPPALDPFCAPQQWRGSSRCSSTLLLMKRIVSVMTGLDDDEFSEVGKARHRGHRLF
jgi:hypothetical protein